MSDEVKTCKDCKYFIADGASRRGQCELKRSRIDKWGQEVPIRRMASGKACKKVEPKRKTIGAAEDYKHYLGDRGAMGNVGVIQVKQGDKCSLIAFIGERVAAFVNEESSLHGKEYLEYNLIYTLQDIKRAIMLYHNGVEHDMKEPCENCIYDAEYRLAVAANKQLADALDKAREENKMLRLQIFAFVRNAAVLPVGRNLHKSEQEITDKTFETIEAAKAMLDVEAVKAAMNLATNKGNRFDNAD
jgi:hypothetical protein